MRLPLSLAILLAACLPAGDLTAGGVGRRFPAETRELTDPVTGLRSLALTTDPANDSKIYQTHPQWTSDGRWIVFRSNRSAGAAETGRTSAAYAVHQGTGEIVQLTEPGGYSGMLNLARKSMHLYFERSAGPDSPLQIVALDLARLLADSTARRVQPAASYERICGTLPAGLRDSGGFCLDADEQFAVIGVRGGDTGTHLPPQTKLVETASGQRMGAGPAGLRRMDLQTGAVSVILDTPFLMGHVQANPWVPNEILYCHETGGDAPQRMWTVRADGTGNRPLFVEGPLDWVTHEAVITRDEVVFNLIGHQPLQRTRPTGIAVINLRNDQVRLYGQVDDNPPDSRNLGGYWHSNGSPDGRWLVGDTFAGNIWLIDRRDGRQSLLSTGHKMRPDHAHPTFSPDSRHILIQSGLLSDGQSLDLILLPVPSS